MAIPSLSYDPATDRDMYPGTVRSKFVPKTVTNQSVSSNCTLSWVTDLIAAGAYQSFCHMTSN